MIQETHEAGHVGYLVETPAGVVVIDPPLRLADSAGGIAREITAVVETSISDRRVSGGRILSEAAGVPLLAPVATAATTPVEPGQRIGELLIVGPVLNRPDMLVLTVNNGRDVFIGSLDLVPGADMARRDLASNHPDARFYGSAGRYGVDELAGLSPAAHDHLNAEAVLATNEGAVDMFWADPRFVDESTSITSTELEQRLAGPWAPTIVCLDSEPPAVDADIRSIRPAALASSFTSLAGQREIVVWSEDPALAERAAGFLVRLGLGATRWLDP